MAQKIVDEACQRELQPQNQYLWVEEYTTCLWDCSIVGLGGVPLYLDVWWQSNATSRQIFINLLLATENLWRGVKIHGCPGAEDSLFFSFNASHLRAGKVDLMMDLGTKMAGRRKKTKRGRTQRSGEFGICEEATSFPLFESCADIITIMNLKKAVTFPPLMEIRTIAWIPRASIDDGQHITHVDGLTVWQPDSQLKTLNA